MRRPNFEDLTPIFPYERISLENGKADLSMRLIDLVAPIGKGQQRFDRRASESGKDGSAEKYRGNYRGKNIRRCW